MKRFFAFAAAAIAAILLMGCAHPINMTPDLAAISSQGAAPINRKVAYSMDDVLRATEVTTPGGGGDKVRYFPYRDFEAGFYKALSETFTGVSKVKNPGDLPALQAEGISLVFVPQITTTSYSDSVLTWPPTIFTIKLVCTVSDVQGKPVKTIEVVADGRASFDEFKSNLSLSAVRASNDALAKLMKALRETPELRN